MRKIILSSIVAVSALSCSRAQLKGDLAYIYDWSKRQSYQVVCGKIGEINNIAGKKISLDIGTWVGTGAGSAAAGFSVSKTVKAADNFYASFGLAAGTGNSKLRLLGPYVGISWMIDTSKKK